MLETGQALTYNYDTLNRLNTIGTGAKDFTYTYTTPVSRMIARLSNPNGTTTRYSYGPMMKRLMAISNQTSANQTIRRHEYAYTNDRIGSETITNAEAITGFQDALIQYDHNALNQLIKTQSPETIFKYDARIYPGRLPCSPRPIMLKISLRK